MRCTSQTRKCIACSHRSVYTCDWKLARIGSGEPKRCEVHLCELCAWVPPAWIGKSGRAFSLADRHLCPIHRIQLERQQLERTQEIS